MWNKGAIRAREISSRNKKERRSWCPWNSWCSVDICFKDTRSPRELRKVRKNAHVWMHSLANLLNCFVWAVVRLSCFCVATFLSVFGAYGNWHRFHAKAKEIRGGECCGLRRLFDFRHTRAAVWMQDHNNVSMDAGCCIILHPVMWIFKWGSPGPCKFVVKCWVLHNLEKRNQSSTVIN